MVLWRILGICRVNLSQKCGGIQLGHQVFQGLTVGNRGSQNTWQGCQMAQLTHTVDHPWALRQGATLGWSSCIWYGHHYDQSCYLHPCSQVPLSCHMCWTLLWFSPISFTSHDTPSFPIPFSYYDSYSLCILTTAPLFSHYDSFLFHIPTNTPLWLIWWSHCSPMISVLHRFTPLFSWHHHDITIVLLLYKARYLFVHS